MRKAKQHYTHNIGFTQKPFEVVFLDVHQAGDVRDVEVVVFNTTGFQVDLRQKRHLNIEKCSGSKC